MHPNTFSIIIPAYNHEAYIDAAIHSVLAQDGVDLELIIIDDCSTDDTWERIQGWTDERIRTLRSDRNQGAAASLNQGVGMARGEFVGVLNSDDAFLPDRLARAERELRSTPEAAAFFSHYEFMDAAGSVVKTHSELQAEIARYAPDIKNLTTGQGQLLQVLAKNIWHTTSNLIVRREIFHQLGGFRPYRYVHDHDFFLRLAAAHPVVFVPDNLLRYRFHGENTLGESAVASSAETAVMLLDFVRSGSFPRLAWDTQTHREIFRFLSSLMQWYGTERWALFICLALLQEAPEADSETNPASALQWLDETAPNLKRDVEQDQLSHGLEWQLEQTRHWWEKAQDWSVKVRQAQTTLEWQEEQTRDWWEKAQDWSEKVRQLQADLDWQKEQTGHWWRQSMQAAADLSSREEQIRHISARCEELEAGLEWQREQTANWTRAYSETLDRYFRARLLGVPHAAGRFFRFLKSVARAS